MSLRFGIARIDKIKCFEILTCFLYIQTSVEEPHAGVLVDHSTMDVDKVNLSTVLAEVVNGSGNGSRNCHTLRTF